MFQVTNLLTYARWSVESRDDLLSELEHANAKRQPLDPKDTLELIHTDENGEVLEKTVIELPLTGTIDEILETFGFGSSKRGKGGFLSRFLPFFPKGKANPPVSKKVAPKPYELPLNDPDDVEQDASSKGILDQLIKDTQRNDEGEIVAAPTATVASSSQQKDRTQNDLVVDPSENAEEPHQSQPTVPPSSTESGKVGIATLPPKHEELEATSTHQQSVAVVKPEEKQVPATLAQPRDVESLTTYDLQMEFAGRIDREVAVIDDRIHELTAQIKQLEAQKMGHLQLLETITTYKLT